MGKRNGGQSESMGKLIIKRLEVTLYAGIRVSVMTWDGILLYKQKKVNINSVEYGVVSIENVKESQVRAIEGNEGLLCQALAILCTLIICLVLSTRIFFFIFFFFFF